MVLEKAPYFSYVSRNSGREGDWVPFWADQVFLMQGLVVAELVGGRWKEAVRAASSCELRCDQWSAVPRLDYHWRATLWCCSHSRFCLPSTSESSEVPYRWYSLSYSLIVEDTFCYSVVTSLPGTIFFHV